MGYVRYLLVNLLGTLLRGFPLPSTTGIIPIGKPDRDSPVFLTCNYCLTVERVRRALRGLDCYLLVANSRGINVWCAAAGGHLTNHDVISALKVSGIEKLVDHREVILPQLAAAGVEASVVAKRIGWHAIWGPVRAKDIPLFIQNNCRKEVGMRQVTFPLADRFQIAVMWAFPFSVIVGIMARLVWPGMLLGLLGLTWAIPFFVFGLFPLFSKLFLPQPIAEGANKPVLSRYSIVFNFTRLPIILWVIFLVGVTIYGLMADSFTPAYLLRWGFASLVLVLLVSIDLLGSTPTHKSDLHADRLLRVSLESDRCNGCGVCQDICPRNCFEISSPGDHASIVRAQACVKCGACIIQCPQDALSFVNPAGETIPPLVLRQFKLNLFGERTRKRD